jgi:deoxyribonuclease-4
LGIYYGVVILLNLVRFGPAGYPADARGKLERVFQILVDAGMNALEYAAVHGLRTSEEKASQIGTLARENKISMSLHAAYYVSLASKSPQIRERSRQRLIKALLFAPSMAVKRIVFHPGTYGGMSKEDAYSVIKDSLQSVWEEAGHQGGGAFLAPEIAGKLSMFGSIEQIIKLCQDVEGCIPTIDWAHLYARRQGELEEKNDYLKVIEQFERELGDLFLENMHFHISGISFTEKGEASHQSFGGEWGPDLYPLMELVNEVGYKPTFICESPNPIRGALYAKILLEEIQKV